MNKYQEPVPIPTMQESLSRVLHFQDDIRVIREEGKIGHTQLARSLGVSRISVYRWEKGKRVPGEPLIILCIGSWAEKLRQSSSGSLRH